jgi:hypothetical protein
VARRERRHDHQLLRRARHRGPRRRPVGTFALNSFLRADNGAAGRFNGDAFWARDAYVGLSGAFGTSLLGRNTTPLFVSTLLFNAFGDSFAFSPSIRQLFTPRCCRSTATPAGTTRCPTPATSAPASACS